MFYSKANNSKNEMYLKNVALQFYASSKNKHSIEFNDQ